MLFMSKQVSLPKISSILQKLKIGPKCHIHPFCMKPLNFNRCTCFSHYFCSYYLQVIINSFYWKENLTMSRGCLRVLFFKKIQDWILKSERIWKRILRFFTKQSNPRSLGSWCVKGTEESTPSVDSSVPLMPYDPRDLGLICLVQKHKIRFWILSDLRIQAWIFVKKSTLSHTCTFLMGLVSVIISFWLCTTLSWQFFIIQLIHCVWFHDPWVSFSIVVLSDLLHSGKHSLDINYVNFVSFLKRTFNVDVNIHCMYHCKFFCFIGLIQDGLSAWQWIRSQSPEAPLYIWGHSLGSG